MSREAFEAACKTRWAGDRGSLTIRADGEYENGHVQFAWWAWQAAQADAFERAARACEEVANRFFQERPLEGNRPYASGQCADAIRALERELGNRKTICARIMSDGKPCGLRGPCPDCGLSLNDFGPDEETGAGK